MIDIYKVSNEEYLEDLFSNHPSGNPTLSSHIDLTSPEVINLLSGNPTSSLISNANLTSPEFKYDSFDSKGDIVINKLLNLDSNQDLPPSNDNPLSGSTTLSSPTLISFEESELIWEEFEAYLASDSFPPGNDDLVEAIPEEFSDELALVTSPPGNDDITPKDVIKEVKCLLTQSPLANYSHDNYLVNTILKMFSDEHDLDYSSPPRYDDFNDDLVEIKSNVYDDPFDYLSPPLWDDYDNDLMDLEPINDYTYDDPFDFKEDKIKESKLLINELNELDSPESSDLLPSFDCGLLCYEDFFRG
ncbi:hypothetical protein Tco_0066764 [Tanacetum coccineum]